MRRNIQRTRRSAYTLVELTVSLSVGALLMTGVTSSIVIASRALPAEESPNSAIVEAHDALDQIADDLLCAKSVVQRSPTLIRFIVADRNNDGSDETIKYHWGGNAGDPLYRTLNNNTPVSIVPAAHQFNLNYDEDAVTTTTGTTEEVESGEAIVAYFDGWPGISSPSTQDRNVNSSNIVSQYFTYSAPSGSSMVKFTKVRVHMRRDPVFPTSFDVAIRRSKNDGSYEPAAANIGSMATAPGGLLQLTAQWIPVNLTNVVVADPSRNDYCLVLSSSFSTKVYATSYYAAGAPPNEKVAKWSPNSGISWSPTAANVHMYDVRFYVYATYFTPTTTDNSVTRNYLRATTLMLQRDADSSTRVDSTVQNLNKPEVTGL